MKKFLIILCATFALIFVACLCLNFAIVFSSQKNITDGENANADVIIVLGCGVKPDGSPSDMLRDRLLTAVDLYKSGAGKKLLLSGDSKNAEKYDEVGTMKRLCLSLGVPEEDIITDDLGLSTFESIDRAKKIYGIENAIIVTQKYHLYRALYIAKSRGIAAVGVPADLHTYGGQLFRDIREIPARVKDFILSTAK